MSPPRRIRLVRADGLDSWQRAIMDAALPADPFAAHQTAVLVPTRAAARQLRRTIEDARLGGPGSVLVLPQLLTRTDWYERLQQAARPGRPWLSGIEREVILQAAAHEAITEGAVPPFTLRPVLLRDMLGLYDELRRRQQGLGDFERLLDGHLAGRAADDRGAERLLRQTRFLAGAFRGYERRVGEAGHRDEHGLRDELLAQVRPEAGSRVAACRSPHVTVVVTVGEAPGDPGGLWPADADLLARLDGILEVTVVSTEARLHAGFHERVHGLFPGIEETRAPARPALQPRRLIVPPADHDTLFLSRDREEELRGVVRQIKGTAREAAPGAEALDRVAVVFRRPLPYLYLAREIFDSAGVPFQGDDALPLAAEPAAAVLDLVLALVESNGSREAIRGLLGSPHLALGEGRTAVGLESVRGLDRLLLEAAYSADPPELVRLLTLWSDAESAPDARERARRRLAAPAVSAAAAAVAELAPLFGSAPVSRQLRRLETFLSAFAAPVPEHDERQLRGGAAVLSVLRGLADAHERYGDVNADIGEIGPMLRRWLEARTFAPRTGRSGVQLLDATAARYACVHSLYCVGLVDGEWPERPRRNIFHAPLVQRLLGWVDAHGALPCDRADFHDLLGLPADAATLSAFQLEDDALVEVSPLIDETQRAGLQRVSRPSPAARIFLDEALVSSPIPAGVLRGETAGWAWLRQTRTPREDARYHGHARAHRPAAYAVGSVEQHAQCPFKYFARYVLRLEEEPRDDQEGLTALERGRFVHEVLERCFRTWHDSGHGAITIGTLDRARQVFADAADPMLADLPPADAMLERTRLFGSAVAPGLIDLVLRIEAERPHAVRDRLLEDRFDGEFELAAAEGPRTIRLRGIADRIDVLEGGAFRVVDYKSSLPPVALQLAIYARVAAARLRASGIANPRLAEAAYIVFGPQRSVRALGHDAEDRERQLIARTTRFLAAIDEIAAGIFPPRPAQSSLCSTCGYAGVCRKEHVPAPAEPAPAV